MKWTEVARECIEGTEPTECMVTSGCVLFCTETFCSSGYKQQSAWPETVGKHILSRKVACALQLCIHTFICCGFKLIYCSTALSRDHTI